MMDVDPALVLFVLVVIRGANWDGVWIGGLGLGISLLNFLAGFFLDACFWDGNRYHDGAYILLYS